MKKIYAILAFALTATLAGCLISGTFVADVDFTVNYSGGFVKESVDLEDYSSDAEQIERVERIDIEAIVYNNLAVTDTIDIYISSTNYASKAQVEGAADAYKLINGYVTQATPAVDTITIAEGRQLIQIPGPDWDAIKDVVKTGTFCVYVISRTGAGANGTVDPCILYITFTAKK